MSFNNRNKIDEKICILKKNKEFLKWFKLTYRNDPLLNVQELQKLVGKVVAWYRSRYTDKDFKEKNLDLEFVSLDYLINILSKNEQLTIECPYTSNSITPYQSIVMDYTNGGKPIYSKYNVILGLQIEINGEVYNFNIDRDGHVNLDDVNGHFRGIVDPITKPIMIEDFYALLPIGGQYDMIKRCLSKHRCDITLRNQIFKFAILELLNYPEYGIERAGLALKDLRAQIKDLHFDELSDVYADQKSSKQKYIKFRKPKRFMIYK